MNPSQLKGLNTKETFSDHTEYGIQNYKKQYASSFFDKGIGRLLTVSELATVLNCSAGTIRNWVYQGLIPVVRPAPRMVRFRITDIENWLSERSDPYGQH